MASTALTKSVPLNGMQGADENGYAGFSGDVNNHFLKIFGAGFITAVLLKTFDNGAQTATTASPFGVATYGSTQGRSPRPRRKPFCSAIKTSHRPSPWMAPRNSWFR